MWLVGEDWEETIINRARAQRWSGRARCGQIRELLDNECFSAFLAKSRRNNNEHNDRAVREGGFFCTKIADAQMLSAQISGGYKLQSPLRIH